MSIEMVALMELTVRIGSEMELIMAKLQIEPGSKAIHCMQGENAGYKDLLSAIAASFELRQTSLQYNGEQPLTIPDLEDEKLDQMLQSVEALKEDERWIRVKGTLAEKTEGMKTFLLFEAANSADLDIAQGKQRSYTSYESLFNAVDQEVRRRAARAEEKKKEPDLPFEAGSDYEVKDEEEERGIVPGGKPLAVIRGGQE